MHSECLIRAGFYSKFVLKCDSKPEGKTKTLILAVDFKGSVKRDRLLLRVNAGQQNRNLFLAGPVM